MPASRPVTPDQQGGAESAMPVAMAALDVAGQIRERSPADMAIFTEGSARLPDRFVRPEQGQALLARAVSEGSAEGVAWLITGAGRGQFRISLWRQRGGERIRILAAFSECAPAPGGAACLAEISRLGHDMRSPLAATMGFAEMIRAEPGSLPPEVAAAHAADIVAAAWRLARIADEIEAAGQGGIPLRPRMAEVDIARLARRVCRLARPAANAAGVAIHDGGLPAPGEGPAVLGDEGMLWSVIDNLVQNALRHAGEGADVALSLDRGRDGLMLTVADTGRGIAPERLAELLHAGPAGRGLGFTLTLARASGGDLEIDSAPGEGVTARLRFPAARVLDQV